MLDFVSIVTDLRQIPFCKKKLQTVWKKFKNNKSWFVQIYFEVFFIFNSRWLHVLVSKKYNIHLKTKRKNFKNAVAPSCLNESEYKGCFLTKDIELLDFETFSLTLCNLIILHCMPTSFRQTFGFC